MASTYDGPIIDAHHHFWDTSLGRHPWLLAIPADSPDRALCASHMPQHYVPMAARNGVVGSVHVEANWDPSDPEGESHWLDSLDRPQGIAEQYIAYAALGRADAPGLLERHAAHPRVVGLREILSWHPDPGKRREALNDRLSDPLWLDNLARAGRFGLSFDVLITPHQFEDVARVADRLPDMSFIINHCGSPMDRDAEGMAMWRDGLRMLAERYNLSIKLSDPVAYDIDWTPQSLTDVIRATIDAFGPARSMFATDYPVAGLHIGFDEWFAVFKGAVSIYSPDEQQQIFHDTAKRIYRIRA